LSERELCRYDEASTRDGAPADVFIDALLYMEGTHRGALDPPGFAPTGRTMRVDGFDQWTMRDSRIAHYRAFYDMNDVARQLGIVPAPGSRAERGMVALQRLQARLSR
jgi:hypothetical protein